MESPIGWSQAVEGLEGEVIGDNNMEELHDLQGYRRLHSM
jgi:hypothetical protein